MMRRCVLGVAIAILIAGSVTFAQDQGRTARYEFTISVPHQLIGPCGDGAIYTRYEVAIKVTDHYDKRGNVDQQILTARTVEPSMYYLGDPRTFDRLPDTNVAMGVPGESEIDRVDMVNGVLYAQGSIFQVTVPGYGRLFSETGHGVALPGTDPITILLNRGHNDYWEEDVAALCDYLTAR